MIRIRGTLIVQTRHGRRGDFTVAKLVCELGEFTVRERMIDAYEAGTYSGEFGVGRIFLAHDRFSNGGVLVEQRARLTHIGLDRAVNPATHATPAAAPSAAREATPADPDEAPPEATVIEDPPPTPTVRSPTPAATEEDAKLFGGLWPLGEVVILDPSAKRAVLRQQSSRLSALGYAFQATTQHWHLKATI